MIRPPWRALITKGSRTSGRKRSAEARRKHKQRKARDANTTTEQSPHVCSTCGRTSRARIGLVAAISGRNVMLNQVIKRLGMPVIVIDPDGLTTTTSCCSKMVLSRVLKCFRSGFNTKLSFVQSVFVIKLRGSIARVWMLMSKVIKARTSENRQQ